ncbi:MFS transporter [Pseudaminobacter salicylatoxidans]|uniref:MFS transporter n=1 Tax=Pseudaminobacter salicylatoxidans TaxID=93369 RepID=UPI0002E089B6|nr:MFS transporter [Pseudaminobacter salicylatoxidans]
MVATLIFAAGSGVCALAPAMSVLLLGRAIQGFGGGLLVAMSYAIVGALYDKALWPRVMALISSMWGLGTLIGPGVGGLFAELGLWRNAFWVLVIWSAFYAALASRYMPRAIRGSRPQPIAWPQLCVLSLAVLALSSASVFTGRSEMVGGIIAGIVLTVMLILIERRGTKKFLPDRGTLLTGELGKLYLTMVFLSITVTSADVFGPLFLQLLHGFSPFQAGYVTALIAFGWMAGSVFNAGRSGASATMAMRLAPWLSFLALVSLVFLMPAVDLKGAAWIVGTCLALFGTGVGVGLIWPHLLARIVAVAPADQADRASASISTVQLFSTALGVSVAAIIVNLAGNLQGDVIQEPGSAATWLFLACAMAPLAAIAPLSRSAPLSVRESEPQPEAASDISQAKIRSEV